MELDQNQTRLTPESASHVSQSASVKPNTNLRSDSTQIIEVLNRKDLNEFLALPREIYANDSLFVMPLFAQVKMLLGPLGKKEKHLFIAKVAGKTVARLAVKIHRHEKTVRLHFGFFECKEGYAYSVKALVEKAQSLYPELEMMGPFHFRQEDPYIGVLVQGYEYAPYFMMPYNPPYYDEYLKAAGLSTVMDLFTYDLTRAEGCPELLVKNGERAVKELGIQFRSLDIKNLRSEAITIAKIFNEALAENWGFEEFDNAQINEMVLMLKYFIDPRIVKFAMKDGKEIGCLLMIPNYNHVIKPSWGRITPGLVLRYLRRYKTTHTIRGYALGVLKAYRSAGIGSALTVEMYREGGEVGYEACEISWVLANNGPMNDLAAAMGGKQRKVYRIYNKLGQLESVVSH